MSAGTCIVTLPLVFPIHNSENRDPFDCAPTSARATRPRPQSDQTACEAIRHARERRGAIMNDANAHPAFEARRLKSAPGWYVRVAWAHGKRDHIPGFVSQQEALRWIETKARSWVSEQTRASFRGLAA
jgi:hypothetical protein